MIGGMIEQIYWFNAEETGEIDEMKGLVYGIREKTRAGGRCSRSIRLLPRCRSCILPRRTRFKTAGVTELEAQVRKGTRKQQKEVLGARSYSIPRAMIFGASYRISAGLV